MKFKNVEKDMIAIHRIKKEVSNYIIGQKNMTDRILIGIFTGTNILLEGLPGLAKTSTINIISRLIGLTFRRIQFTGDLSYSDIIGSTVYYSKIGEFITKKGPIFSNIILVDEINRAPAKVQAALLEAMQERQVTIGNRTYKLESPFTILATQNPIEQDGVYPLPEAQQDRFLMKVKVSYPSRDEEKYILNRFADNNNVRYNLEKFLSKIDVLSIKESIKFVNIEDKLRNYILDIVLKTREQSKYSTYGVSPRGTLALVLSAKAIAFFNGRNHVTIQDIKSIAHDVLDHRMVMSKYAKNNNITSNQFISTILDNLKI